MNKAKQKRVIILVAPLVIAAIIALFFYGLGGGEPKKQEKEIVKGINTTLPQASVEEKNPLDKLSIYRKAEKDSALLQEQLNRDPFFKRLSETSIADSEPVSSEKSLMDKLALLETQLKNKPSSSNLSGDGGHAQPPEYNPPIYRQRQLPIENDPEVDQLNQLMDKALALKYPERMKAQDENDNKRTRKTLSVDIKTDSIENGTFDNVSAIIQTTNRFYESDDELLQVQQGTAAISASVDGAQPVISGSEVKLRLDQEITVKGINIPTGAAIFAIASFSTSRMQLSIQNIQYKNIILPVSLEVYGYDGMPGIPLTDAVMEEVAKQGADRSLQSLQLTTMDPSIGAQAAAAGIETAKRLINRKTRMIKIKLKAGYPVLLRNTDK